MLICLGQHRHHPFKRSANISAFVNIENPVLIERPSQNLRARAKSADRHRAPTGQHHPGVGAETLPNAGDGTQVVSGQGSALVGDGRISVCGISSILSSASSRRLRIGGPSLDVSLEGVRCDPTRPHTHNHVPGIPRARAQPLFPRVKRYASVQRDVL